MFTVRQVNGTWQVYVHPVYYGILMFAQATPPGSRLLPISGSAPAGLSSWATRGGDGTTRVVLINRDTHASRSVAVGTPAGAGAATVALLRAPGIGATQGITLGGQSFGPQTSTGQLAGTASITTLKPDRHQYSVKLPAASAALLTISKR
jgi:hypothetical protein